MSEVAGGGVAGRFLKFDLDLAERFLKSAVVDSSGADMLAIASIVIIMKRL